MAITKIFMRGDPIFVGIVHISQKENRYALLQSRLLMYIGNAVH